MKHPKDNQNDQKKAEQDVKKVSHVILMSDLRKTSERIGEELAKELSLPFVSWAKKEESLEDTSFEVLRFVQSQKAPSVLLLPSSFLSSDKGRDYLKDSKQVFYLSLPPEEVFKESLSDAEISFDATSVLRIEEHLEGLTPLYEDVGAREVSVLGRSAEDVAKEIASHVESLLEKTLVAEKSVLIEETIPKKKKFRFRKIHGILLGVFVLLLFVGFVSVRYFLWQTVQKVDYHPSDREILFPTDLVEPDGTVNVLLLGTDENSEEFSATARADSIMIASVNIKTGSAHLVSLERGIGVSIPEVGEDWLTHVFAYGGPDLMVQIVQEQFSLDIGHYARVNFQAFQKIIDVFGGITLPLTAEEAAALEPITHGTMQEGETFLNGYDALQYARLRNIDSDFYRIQRQRNVIQQVVYELQDASLRELYALSQEVLPLVQTNISPEELLSLVWYAPKFLGMTLEQLTIPQPEDMLPGKQLPDGRILTQIDFEKSSQRIHDFIYEK